MEEFFFSTVISLQTKNAIKRQKSTLKRMVGEKFDVYIIFFRCINSNSPGFCMLDEKYFDTSQNVLQKLPRISLLLPKITDHFFDGQKVKLVIIKYENSNIGQEEKEEVLKKMFSHEVKVVNAVKKKKRERKTLIDEHMIEYGLKEEQPDSSDDEARLVDTIKPLREELKLSSEGIDGFFFLDEYHSSLFIEIFFKKEFEENKYQ